MAFPCTLVIFSMLLAVFNSLRFGQMIYIAVLAGNSGAVVSLLVLAGVSSLISFCVKMAGVVRSNAFVIWAYVGSCFFSILLEFLTSAAMLLKAESEFGIAFNLDVQLAAVLLVSQDSLITAHLFRLNCFSRRKKFI